MADEHDYQIIAEWLKSLGLDIAAVLELAFSNREKDRFSLTARRKLRDEGNYIADQTEVDRTIAKEATALGINLEPESNNRGRRRTIN